MGNIDRSLDNNVEIQAQAVSQQQLQGAVSRLPPTSQPYHVTGSNPDTVPIQPPLQAITTQSNTQSQIPARVQQQAVVVSQPQVDYNILPPHIQSQIDEFRAGNQIHSRHQAAPTGDIQIGQLRSDPNLRHSVDVGLNSVVGNIPSLSNATPHRSVSFNLPTNQGNGHPSSEQNPTSEGVYEWVLDRNGCRHLVHRSTPQVNTNPYAYSPHMVTSQSNLPSRREYRCSPTSGRLYTVEVPNDFEHGMMQQSSQYRLEYRCCPVTGRTWQEKVLVGPSSPIKPSFIWEWRIDPLTGERFRVKVQTTTGVSSANSVLPARSQHMFQAGANNVGINLDGSYAQPPGKSGMHSDSWTSNTGTDSRSINMTGITRIEKNGKKGHRLVDLAKQCPAKWSKQTTSNSISMPLYMWASISELEAALSGRSQQIHETELVGKLRHIKHTLEVCCLNSSSTDYSGYGWLIAKDYAFKVEEEVANGLIEWSDLQAGLRTNTLVLSQMDCPRQSSNKSAKTKDSDKQLCTTFNKCTTSGKCDYEVANPGRSCQRRHECSWCRNNLGQGNKHQERECRKKNDNGD